MAKRFVHYNGTVAQFKALSNIADYANSIVFISGDEAGIGAAIYTHEKYYSNVEDYLATVDDKLAALQYISSVKAGDVTATATGPNGVIEFKTSDPATVEVKAGSTGVTIGLKSDFVTKVDNTATAASDNAAAIAAETQAREAAINSVNTAIAAKADTTTVTTLAGRVTAIEDDYLKEADIEGKLDVDTYNIDKAALEKADTDNLAAAKSYADGLAKNYDAAGAAAAVQADATQALQDAADAALSASNANAAAEAAQSTADANKTAIEAMDLTAVTGYVTSVSQVDGKVSASAVANIPATDITVTDTANKLDSTNVEAALNELAVMWDWEEL